MTLPTALDCLLSCRAATPPAFGLGAFYSPVMGQSAVDGFHMTRKETPSREKVKFGIAQLSQAQAFQETHGRANRMRYSDRRSWESVSPFSNSPTGVSAPDGIRFPPCSTAGGFGPRPFQEAAE